MVEIIWSREFPDVSSIPEWPRIWGYVSHTHLDFYTRYHDVYWHIARDDVESEQIALHRITGPPSAAMLITVPGAPNQLRAVLEDLPTYVVRYLL